MQLDGIRDQTQRFESGVRITVPTEQCYVPQANVHFSSTNSLSQLNQGDSKESKWVIRCAWGQWYSYMLTLLLRDLISDFRGKTPIY